jgi:hypothetical protein
MKKFRDYYCKLCKITVECFIEDGVVVTCEACKNEMSVLPSAPGMVKTNFADKTGFKQRN